MSYNPMQRLVSCLLVIVFTFTQLELQAEVFTPKIIPPKPIIYHIQDIHAHAEAQFEISRILETVSRIPVNRYASDNELIHLTGEPEHRQTGKLLVLVEGASGPVDVASFAAFPEPSVRRDTFAEFVRSGWVSGAEYLAIATKESLHLEIQGIEDPQLYLRHFETFQEAMETQEETYSWLERRARSLAQSIKRHFNPRLRSLYQLNESFENGTISLTHFVERLIQSAHQEKVSLKSFYALIQYRDLLRAEKNVANKELSKEELKKMIRKIVKLLRRHKKFNVEKLMAEIRVLSARIQDRLTITTKEKNLRKIIHEYQLLKNILRLQAASEEWSEWQRLKRRPSVKGVEEDLDRASRFYELALERDQTLARNAFEYIKKNRSRVAVVITGGFHTHGIQDQLRKNHLQVQSLIPQVKDVSKHDRYIEIMKNLGSRKALAICSPFSVLMDYLNPVLRKILHVRMMVSLAVHYLRHLSWRNLKLKNLGRSLVKPVVALILLAFTLIPHLAKGEEPAPTEDRNLYAGVSGLFSADDINASQFFFGKNVGDLRFQWRVGSSRFITHLLDPEDFQFYKESVPRLGLFSLYMGDVQSAEAHLYMPQYVFYTDIDARLGDVDLVLGIQTFMLPRRMGDEYRLSLGEVVPYGGIRWRMFHWDTLWGPIGFLGDLEGKIFYQRTPPERFYDPTAFDRSEMTLDSRFEYELERNMSLYLPFQIYADFQPWMEYIWQSIKWDRPDPTYDEAFRVIEEQVSRGFGFYGKLNFDDLEDAIISGEKGLEPNPNAKVKLRAPTILGIKLGPELVYRKGVFSSRVGGGVELFWVPQLTISAVYKNDFKRALQQVFTPWDFQMSPYTYFGVSYESGGNHAGLDLTIHGPKFSGDDEFPLDLPIPWSFGVSYERTGLLFDSWDLETFIRYRNFTDPFGYVIIPDSRLEGGVILRFGKVPETRRMTGRTKAERLRLKEVELREEIKEREEELEEERKELQDKERRLEEERRRLKEQVKHSSFFFGFGGLLRNTISRHSGLRAGIQYLFRHSAAPRNFISRTFWRWIFGLLLLVLPACGLFSSFPVDRLEKVTVTEQEDDVYELFPAWEFIEPDGEYEQSPHVELVRDSNNAYRLKEGQTFRLKFKPDFKESNLAKLYIFLDFMSYYSNGIPHEFSIRDADGVSYRFNVDATGGEDKEYKIDVEKLVHAMLNNGLNLDRLRAIEIHPLGSGHLEINFPRNPIALLNNGRGPIRDLENLSRGLYDSTAFSGIGTVDLTRPDPRKGEDTLRATWQDTSETELGVKAVATSTKSTGVYTFGDRLTLNIASTSPILNLELIDLSGNVQTLLLGNAKPEGSLLWLSQDSVKERVSSKGIPVNLDAITSIALYAQNPKEKGGFIRVQGLFEDDAGELGAVTFTDAADQDVTLLTDDGFWSVSGLVRLSLDSRYVDNGKQGALEFSSGGHGAGFVAQTQNNLPLGNQDALRYVVTGVDHVLTFFVQDEMGQEIPVHWNIRVPADMNRKPVFVSLPLDKVVKDLQDEGYGVAVPLKIKSVYWQPEMGSLRLLEYLTLNAIQPLWVAIPSPVSANSAVDYFDVTGAGPLNAMRLSRFYFVGQNPLDLERNYFRYEALQEGSGGRRAGMWMNVSDRFLEPWRFNFQLTSTEPLLTLEVKDEGNHKVPCYLLNPSPESRQFSVSWDPEFARLINPSLGLGSVRTVSLYADGKDLGRQHNSNRPYSGEVSFKGLIAPAQVPRGHYAIASPQPISATNPPDYLEINSTGRVFYQHVSDVHFAGVDAFQESGFSFSHIYPSWLRVENNRAGVYFELSPASQDFSGRRTFTVQARGVLANRVLANKGVLVFKDGNGQEAYYRLDQLTPDLQTYVLDLTLLEGLNPAIDRIHITAILYLADADLLWNGQDDSYQGSLGLKGIKRAQFGSLRRKIMKEKAQFAQAA